MAFQKVVQRPGSETRRNFKPFIEALAALISRRWKTNIEQETRVNLDPERLINKAGVGSRWPCGYSVFLSQCGKLLNVSAGNSFLFPIIKICGCNMIPLTIKTRTGK